MDQEWSLLNVDETFPYVFRRSIQTHQLVPAERPPAVLNADDEIPEFTEAQRLIVEARARLDKLLADREQAKLAVVATEEARAALTRKVAKGERINLGQAEKIAIERAGHEQTIEMIEEAIQASEIEWMNARLWLRKVLKHAANEVVALLLRKSQGAEAEIRRIKERSETWSAWARDIQIGLNGQPDEDALKRVLGI